MFRISISIITLFLIITLAFMLGCGSEDDVGIVQPVIPVEGELTDIQFLFADDAMESDIMRTTEISFLTPIFFLMNLPTQPTTKEWLPNASDISTDNFLLFITKSDTPTISTEGWYVFNYEMTVLYETADSISVVGVDSIRLLNDSTVVEWNSVGTLFDMIETRNTADWESNRMSSGISRHNIDLLVLGDISLQTLGANISIVDTTRQAYEDEGGFCYVNQYTTATATDILVIPNFGMFSLAYCADSGTVDISTIVDLDCTEHSLAKNWGVEGLWKYEGSYNSENILSYKLTHGDKFWFSADTCEVN